MSTIINPGSGLEKPKSFWSKPEGVTGTVVLAGLLIGGGAIYDLFVGYVNCAWCHYIHGARSKNENLNRLHV